MAGKGFTRLMVPAKLTNKYPAKQDSYDQKMKVGLKFTVYDPEDGEKIEWVNLQEDDQALEGLDPGQDYFLMKEWSAKKKNKETQKEGAFVYRYVDTSAIVGSGRQAAQAPVTQAVTPGLRLSTIQRAAQALLWLNKKDGSDTPGQRVVGIWKDSQLIDDTKAGHLNAGFQEAQELVIRLGKMYAVLKPPIDQKS